MVFHWREAPPVRWFCGTIGLLCTMFALDIMRIGDVVTSRQWQYLMSVPGHKYAWTIIFFTAGVCTLLGEARAKYRLAAFGLLLMGASALGIATFYYLGPFLNADFLTLGYWTWVINSVVMLAMFAVNWTDKEW